MGPAIVATPATAPQTPNAAPRRSGGNVIVTMARVCGISMAAPRPWTARKPISQPAPGANPQAAEATVNTTIPATNMVRGPEQVPEPPRRDHQDGEHQRVGVEHPQHVVQGGVQPVDHVGDRDVDDRQVEQRHEEAE